MQNGQTSNSRQAMIVEYDGAEFAGFQLQEGEPTVQGELERALSTFLREPIRLHCAGRTDAGVHAAGQVISFVCRAAVPPERRTVHSCNALLPRSVTIKRSLPAPADFHARFSCIAREYEYLIWNDPVRSSHWEGRALWVRHPLPVDELHEELQQLLGEKDFAALTRVEYKNDTTQRCVDLVELTRKREPLTNSESLVVLRIRGNSFLHNMIRIIVGTLVDRSQGKIKENIGALVASKDRLRAGQTAPPYGLYFRHAYYRPDCGVNGLPTLDSPRLLELAERLKGEIKKLDMKF